MIYLLSVTLVSISVFGCLLANVYLRLLRTEKFVKEIHETVLKEFHILKKEVTSQIAFVDDAAKKANLSISSYTNRVEELNNKIAALALKR